MSYSRKRSREAVYRMLFHLAFGQTAETVSDVLEIACDGDELPDGPELEYISNLYKVSCDNIAETDKIIEQYAVGFSFERIFKTDLTALRLGIAEMKYTDVQPAVAVNEAVEIAKKYGTEKSSAFVNGILGKVAVDCANSTDVNPAENGEQ